MPAEIKISYDPKEAQKGLQGLRKETEAAAKSLDTMGTKATSAGSKVDKLAKSNLDLEKTVKSNIGGFGELAGVTSALGSAVGGTQGQIISMTGNLTNLAGQAANAAVSFGPLGLAVIGVTAAVSSAIGWWQSYTNEVEENTRQLEEQRKRQEQIDKTWLQETLAIRGEFEAIERKHETDRINATIKQKTLEIDSIQAIAKQREFENLRQKLIIEEGKKLFADNLKDQKRRQELLEEYQRSEAKVLALQEREGQLINEQKEAERERYRLAQDAEREKQRLQEEGHRQRLLQIQEEKRREMELAALRQKQFDDEFRLFKQRVDQRGQPEATGGASGGAGQPAAIVPGGVADENGVIRGRDKGPLQFAGSAIAANVMGRQAALSQGAIARQNAARAQAFNIRMGNADRQSRGDFSMDKRGGPTVREMRAGQAGQVQPDGQQGTFIDQLGQRMNQRDITERIAQNRVEAVNQERAAALARGIGIGGVPPSAREQRAINQQFDNRARLARRGAFRGEGVTDQERESAIGELAVETAKAAQAQGRLSEKTVQFMEKMVNDSQEEQRRIIEAEQRIDQLEAIQDAQTQNFRKRAQRGARGN